MASVAVTQFFKEHNVCKGACQWLQGIRVTSLKGIVVNFQNDLQGFRITRQIYKVLVPCPHDLTLLPLVLVSFRSDHPTPHFTVEPYWEKRLLTGMPISLHSWEIAVLHTIFQWLQLALSVVCSVLPTFMRSLNLAIILARTSLAERLATVLVWIPYFW